MQGYDLKKSPSCYQRVLSVMEPQSIIIERGTDSYYLLREIRATWRDYVADGSAVLVTPMVEFIQATSSITRQNTPYDMRLIAIPGMNRSDRAMRLQRNMKINDPYYFKELIHIRVSLESRYVIPCIITVMLLGYNIER